MRNLKKVLSLSLSLVMLLGLMMVGAGAATTYTDADDIAGYARGSVQLCYRLGIMSGGDDGSFAPLATATRAQVAVVMVQMARVMGK